MSDPIVEVRGLSYSYETGPHAKGVLTDVDLTLATPGNAGSTSFAVNSEAICPSR